MHSMTRREEFWILCRAYARKGEFSLRRKFWADQLKWISLYGFRIKKIHETRKGEFLAEISWDDSILPTVSIDSLIYQLWLDTSVKREEIDFEKRTGHKMDANYTEKILEKFTDITLAARFKSN